MNMVAKGLTPMSTDSVVIEFPRRHRMFHEPAPSPALGLAICLMVPLVFWPLLIFGFGGLIVHMSRLVLA